MNFKRSTAPLALALTIACAAAGPPAASAGEGFGYDDPRSMQINPSSFDVLPDGGIIFVQDSKVEEISPSGEITTVAGGGRGGVSLNPVPATSVRLDAPIEVAATDDGGFLLGGIFGTVWRVTPRGMISIAAGNGKLESSGDGGPATKAGLQTPAGIAQTTGNGFVVADALSGRVREVSPDGTIDTLAGGGTAEGDGGRATDAAVRFPFAVEPFADGGILIGDISSARVREVLPDGTITTVAGTGQPGFSGDGGAATSAQLSGSGGTGGVGPSFIGPTDLAATPGGDFLLVDSGNRRVREVSSGGTITTVAGTGKGGYNGDGIAATKARLTPRDVALTGDGGFLVLDFDRIRKVSADGEISTIAGIPANRNCRSAPYNGIQGSRKADSLNGGALRDLIRGEGGDDEIDGGANADCLDGGNGSDRLSGKGGSDVIEAGGGEDMIYGGRGADRIDGGRGSDLIVGGAGDDSIKSNNNGADPDRVRCGPGHDRVRADKADRVAPNCEKVIATR